MESILEQYPTWESQKKNKKELFIFLINPWKLKLLIWKVDLIIQAFWLVVSYYLLEADV